MANLFEGSELKGETTTVLLALKECGCCCCCCPKADGRRTAETNGAEAVTELLMEGGMLKLFNQ